MQKAQTSLPITIQKRKQGSFSLQRGHFGGTSFSLAITAESMQNDLNVFSNHIAARF